ncbi:tail fiber domain-containing protein [Dyadobacter sp. CY347]|uniref:tail fiber domain-containing protein n=1 Tax=Dyadobacter sp. CY347 TaxID=2909336 RepID=UPI001F3746FB|nr:tail fiber domain-containing protein [Dyadobacter sp. CY347]MCF2491490.1 tail fiber domain-containing protein [Dyadobacter sp. CY347]
MKKQTTLLRALTLGVVLFCSGQQAHSQVKVGDNPQTINAASALEIESGTKGLLLPRVSLTATDVWGLDGTPVAGMQVYNINADIKSATANEGVGVYYWDGLNWIAAKYVPSEATAAGDFDWLKQDDSQPNAASDITSSLYHGGTGSQQVEVRTTDTGIGTFSRVGVGHGHETTNAIGAYLFAANMGERTAGLQVDTAHPFVFNTKATNDNLIAERMRIDSDYGFIGIGTKTPHGLLSVAKGSIFQSDTPIFTEANNSVQIGGGGVRIMNNTGDLNGFVDFMDKNLGVPFGARLAWMNDVGDSKGGAFKIQVRQKEEGINIVRNAVTVMNNTGKVGINTNFPAYQLDVNGDIQASGEFLNSGQIVTSDERLKTEINTLEKGLAIVSKLMPVTYKKKESISSNDYKRSEIGFIAQEVRKILPQLVREGKDTDKLLGLDYISLIPILTRAIQEQQQLIEKLSAEKNGQSARLDAQGDRLDTQAKELSQIKQMLQSMSQGNTVEVSK